MAELIYDESGRLLFTEEMKKEYTILMPQMLPIHFNILRECLCMEGYKIEMLNTTHRGIVDTGLKYVHNDTCYPALLVIGQLIDAVQSGKYDPHKIALIITQTGGGCRASNYIHLLRKALEKAGLEFVPVVSLNLSGLDKNPGFNLSVQLLIRFIFALVYGDIIMLLANQCRPYEVEKGATDEMIIKWENELLSQFKRGKGLRAGSFKKNLERIACDFDAIELTGERKVRVGIVGEIYVKYAPLGNNNLEEFLLSEGCEPVVPGLLDFVIFKAQNRVTDINLYGGSKIKRTGIALFIKYIENRQKDLINTVKRHRRFHAPGTFQDLKSVAGDYLGEGNKMGEGWLLTGEMLELIHSGITDIVCTQPFGCLPNHIVGKGMIRPIKQNFPESNIVAIDYDPGATKINQENRIKLMLSNAKAKHGVFNPKHMDKEKDKFIFDKKEQEKVLV